jgi:hypothetical protein
MIGFLTFMALEAVAMMYANVLRDHAYGEFDALCKAEVAFFVARAVINVSVFLFKEKRGKILIVYPIKPGTSNVECDEILPPNSVGRHIQTQ